MDYCVPNGNAGKTVVYTQMVRCPPSPPPLPPSPLATSRMWSTPMPGVGVERRDAHSEPEPEPEPCLILMLPLPLPLLPLLLPVSDCRLTPEMTRCRMQ
jgi:hypothetical protein